VIATDNKDALYYKEGRRYKLAGYNRPAEMPDGLWLVTHNRSRLQNVFYRLQEVPDLCEVADMVRGMVLEEIVLQAAMAVWDDGGRAGSLADFSQEVTRRVYMQLREDKAACRQLDKALADK